jgi:7,8-dihydropterin-6-yl-methyl-4-(beta-D-ribofuranosyl)aminobenzene 5'-phosphate synthase
MRCFCVIFCLCAMALPISAFGDEPDGLKVSVLCDDAVASDEFLKEHGVSILIALPNGNRWLFDTGTTNVFIENAKILGESLDHLTGIMISHGHDDHTGGLAFYPLLKGEPPIYGHPEIWIKQYEIKKGEPLRVCGFPYLARRNAAPRFKPINHVTRLDENMYFFTDIPREPGSYCPTHGKFYNEDGTGPWTGNDDATVAIDTPKGIVVIFGCAHAGYTNILKAVQREFPDRKILSVIGGLHLKGANDQVLEEAVALTDSIKAEGFTFYGGHCTGKNAVASFKAKFGEDAVKPMGSGRSLTF